MIDEKRFAVLIDSENISVKYIKYILEEISNYGVVTYKRIYGDWTKHDSSSWKDVLLEHSITPVQQYSYTQGKNATDSAMIIDAMDILYSGNVEGFCIVSSDSDFTKLSARLRESGMLVVGMGEKKTPKPFIAACNQFKYLDVLAETEKKSLTLEEENKGNEKSESKIEGNGKTNKNMTDINEIKSAIIKMMNEIDAEEQSMNIGELGDKLVKRYPDFDVRNYGYTKLSKFLRDFAFLKIEVKAKKGIWVSLKTGDVQEQNYGVKRNKRKKK